MVEDRFFRPVGTQKVVKPLRFNVSSVGAVLDVHKIFTERK